MATFHQNLCGITAVEPHSNNLPALDAGTPQSPVVRIPQQAESDEQLIQLWLHGRSKHTVKGYNSDIAFFGRRLIRP